jgi:hypothetical protein
LTTRKCLDTDVFKLRWAVVARSQRGGRDLPTQFTFWIFCDWTRHVLEEELNRRWEIEMNGVGCVRHLRVGCGLTCQPAASDRPR